jgi:hypothetical protein
MGEFYRIECKTRKVLKWFSLEPTLKERQNYLMHFKITQKTSSSKL